jgi:glutamyl-tRNA synthetase
MLESTYIGRLAPTPTGRLHLGHALTFWTAWQRCRERDGVLIYRNEDLDPDRCRPEFDSAAVEDLLWLGLDWDQGPDQGGPHEPYDQSKRTSRYREAWQRLVAGGHIYPCRCSRKDLQDAARAPHEVGGEAIYPGTCRPAEGNELRTTDWPDGPGKGDLCWRFRVPYRKNIRFSDGRMGEQSFTAGVDFGDFVIWRRDGVPAYELAVVVDDAAMGVTEVVRGADLLLSTARQKLLYQALDLRQPGFFHSPLVAGPDGRRMAKRNKSASIKELRRNGATPDQVLALARRGVMPDSDG